jgi:hypothetical protein
VQKCTNLDWGQGQRQSTGETSGAMGLPVLQDPFAFLLTCVKLKLYSAELLASVHIVTMKGMQYRRVTHVCKYPKTILRVTTRMTDFITVFGYFVFLWRNFGEIDLL